MNEEKEIIYGPVVLEDKSEITLYLDATDLSEKQIHSYEEGGVDCCMGGNNQAYHLPHSIINRIEMFDNMSKTKKSISYEEYIARINNGHIQLNVDHYWSRKSLDEDVRVALEIAVGDDLWDGVINYSRDHYAVIRNQYYIGTYFVQLVATKL